MEVLKPSLRRGSRSNRHQIRPIVNLGSPVRCTTEAGTGHVRLDYVPPGAVCRPSGTVSPVSQARMTTCTRSRSPSLRRILPT